MKNTKIDWCDSTWNPVTGCKFGCDYCYAKKIAERFGNPTDGSIHELTCEVRKRNPDGSEGAVQPYPFGFSPTLHEHRLIDPSCWDKPRNIFVCSMADLFGDWVPLEWIQKVFQACKDAPQHRYLFLTKNPARYISLAELGLLPTADNMWYGTSMVGPTKPYFWSEDHNTFISIEPIHERFEIKRVLWTDWIIVGAETGKRKDKVIPPKEWIVDLKESCKRTVDLSNIPIFMKSSLDPIMGDEIVRQFPWD